LNMTASNWLTSWFNVPFNSGMFMAFMKLIHHGESTWRFFPRTLKQIQAYVHFHHYQMRCIIITGNHW
jgi:hypothetical protein